MGRIEICGGVASGKTTLAKILEEEKFHAIYERFEDNPFLKEFYLQNGIDTTFETEMAFLLLHYNLIKREVLLPDKVCDYSLLQDYSYGTSNLKEGAMVQFDILYNYLLDEIGRADMIVYLKCDIGVLLERIHFRNREMEQSITAEYLVSTITALENVLKNQNNVLIIDSDKYNFLNKDRRYVVNKIVECWDKIVSKNTKR